MIRYKSIKKIALLSVFASTLLFASCASESKIVGTNTGNKAPEISSTDSTGKTITLSELKGKVVLVEFWASTCNPARRDHFEMERLYEKYKDENFKKGNGFCIFSVSIDKNKEAWKKAIREDHISWPCQVNDFTEWNSKPILDYNVSEVPKYLLIDEKGNILNRYMLISDLEKTLQKYAD